MSANSQSLAQKLEAVLEGVLPLQCVIEDSTNFQGSAIACFHGLHHFLADADIREKDSSYRSMQENEMRKLIRLLKAGAGSNELEKITFLGISDA